TEKIASLTAWDPFFIEKIRRLVRMESALRESPKDTTRMSEAKRLGFADESIAALTGLSELAVRRARPRVVYKMVDTCGGEFEAETPYFYSTYEPGGETQKFAALMQRLRIRQPEAASGYSFEEVREVAARIGYPVLVRPSYVLGGRGMEIVHGEEDLARFMETAVRVSKDHPVLVDRYLSHATEIDVDVVADGQDIFIGGIQAPV